MTICAFRPLPLMFAAVNRKMISVVLQILRRDPIRVGGMAQNTVVGEIGSDVVRISGTFKIRQVARHAGIGGSRKIPADMAFCTICNFMAFGQGEKIMVDLVGMPAGRMKVVAF